MSKQRRTPKVSPATAGALISAGATLFVAATAFRLAYAGSKGAATDAGLNTSDAAWYPLCIEGVLVVAAVATVVLRSPYPWVVLLGFSGLSIGANVQHAVDQPGAADWFMLLVAAVPPAALPLCVELSIRIVKKLTQTPAAGAIPAGPTAGLDAPAPTGGTGPEVDLPASVTSGPAQIVPAAAGSPGGGRSSVSPAPPGDAGGLGVAAVGADTLGPDQGHVDHMDPVTPDPMDHHRGPVHMDPVDPDQGHAGRSTGSRVQGHVDLDRLTPDQLVDHHLDRSTPALTLDQLALRLDVSRSTAKRRVHARRQARAGEAREALRVVR